MGAPTLTFSLPTALLWKLPALPAISQPAMLVGAEGTPLGGCQGEALKYSKLMHGSSPSQPRCLVVPRVGTLDAGKHAL